MCSKKIGLCVTNLYTIPRSIVNILRDTYVAFLCLSVSELR